MTQSDYDLDAPDTVTPRKLISKVVRIRVMVIRQGLGPELESEARLRWARDQ